MAQRLKRLPPVRETWVRSLGREDPLEKEMVTHSSILAGRIPWTENLVGYSPWGRKESDRTERLHFHFHFLCMTEFFCCSPETNTRLLAGYTAIQNKTLKEYGGFSEDFIDNLINIPDNKPMILEKVK